MGHLDGIVHKKGLDYRGRVGQTSCLHHDCIQVLPLQQLVQDADEVTSNCREARGGVMTLFGLSSVQLQHSAAYRAIY